MESRNERSAEFIPQECSPVKEFLNWRGTWLRCGRSCGLNSALRLLAVSMLVFLLLAASRVDGAENLAQMRARIDSWLQGKFAVVTSREDTYFANHGKYWQGLVTHVNPPAQTTAAPGDSVPDRFSARPTDQAETWNDMFPEISAEQFPAALKIDVYTGPDGSGWVATLIVRYNGTLYCRSKGTGAEGWRDTGWTLYLPDT